MIVSQEEIKKLELLDEAAEKAGGFVSLVSGKDIHYDYRKINEYCKKRGIEPIDLTIRELNSFIVQ